MYARPLRKRRRLSRPSPQDPVLATHQFNSEQLTAERPSNHVWSSLPPEVLVHIFSNLTSPTDRRSVMFVCRSWKDAMNTKALWKRSTVCIKRVPATARPLYWSILQGRGLVRFTVRANLTTTTEILTKLAEHAPELVSLQLEFTEGFAFVHNPTKELLDTVGKFSCLRRVGLVGNGLQEIRGIEAVLRKLPELKELQLARVSCAKLHTQTLSHEQLQSLHLQHIPSLTCVEVTSLINMFPKVESLQIQACIFDESFLHTSGVKKEGFSPITKLSLANTTFDGEEVCIPFRLKFLKSLNLSSCRQSEEQLSHLLDQFDNLKELVLAGNECTDAVLKKLSCPLRSLELKHCVKVTERGVRELVEFCSDSLEHLSLAQCSGVDVSLLKDFHKLFPKLIHLDLSGWTTLTAANLKPLQKVKSLRRLIFLAIRDSETIKKTLYSNFRKNHCKLTIVC